MEEVKYLMDKTIKLRTIQKAVFGGLARYPKSNVVITTELGPKGYKTGLTIDEEKYFEEYLGLDKGTLSQSPRETDEGRGIKSNFWANLEIRFPNKMITLDLNKAMDYLKYKVCLSSSKVANSISELYKYPDALFAIIDEEELAQVENHKVDLEVEAYELFMAMNDSQKKGVLKLFGKRGIENTSPAIIKSTLAKILKSDPAEFIRVVKDKNIQTKIFIEDLLETRIISRAGNYFKNGDDPIGNSTEEVVGYFENPKNSAIVAALKSKLETKLKQSK